MFVHLRTGHLIDIIAVCPVRIVAEILCRASGQHRVVHAAHPVDERPLVQNGVEIMRLAGDVVVDAVNHDEVLIALQRKVAAVEIGRIQHIALRIRVLHIGGQPVGDADIGGELFIVILVCIPGQDRLADPVELFGAAGKPGGLVNPRAAGLQILNGEGIRRDLVLRAHAQHRGRLGESVKIRPEGIPVLRLRDASENAEGVLSALQTHAVGVRRDRHHVHHALGIARGCQAAGDGIPDRFVGTEHDDGFGAESAVAVMMRIQQVHRPADGGKNRMIIAGFVVSEAEIGLFVGIVLSLHLFGKHVIGDEGPVLAGLRQGGDDHDGFVLPHLEGHAGRRKVRVLGGIFHIRIVIGALQFALPAALGVSRGGILVRGGRQIENQIGRARVVAEAGEKLSLRGQPQRVKLIELALLNAEVRVFQLLSEFLGRAVGDEALRL